MAPLHRLLVGLSMVLLLTGAAGVVSHKSGSEAGRGASPATTPTSSTPQSVRTTAPGPPGPGTAALESGLVTPTDMGGYYRTVPSAGVALLQSSSCLSPLGADAGQSGHAVTALFGPDEHSVPTFVEEVASYPGASARAHYQSAVSALAACSDMSFDIGGPKVSTRPVAGSIPPVGDADRVWSGSFAVGGSKFSLQIGVVLSGQDVLALIWIDSVPPSDPVMGSFVSTVSLAIGKLA